MRHEYQTVFSEKIKEYRLIRHLSQEEIAICVDYERSYISKLENGRAFISHETALNIVDRLSMDLVTKKEELEAIEKLFLDLYIATLAMDNDKIEYCRNLIKAKKDYIASSLCCYKYGLYDFVYLVHKRVLESEYLIDGLLDHVKRGYYSLSDTQILYCSIGYLYVQKRDFEKGQMWYDRSLDINCRSLGYAMSAYRSLASSYFKNDSMLRAIVYLNEAINIFSNYNVESKIVDCQILLASAAYKTRDHKQAIAIYEELLKKDRSITRRYHQSQLLSALIWNAIMLRDDKKIIETIKQIEVNHSSDIDSQLVAIILYYFCLKDDIISFKKWSKYTDVLSEQNDLYQAFFKLLKEMIGGGKVDVIETLANKVLSYCRPYTNQDEYLMVKMILKKSYKQNDLKDEYIKILEELSTL